MVDDLAWDHSRKWELFSKLQELLNTNIPSMNLYCSVLKRASDASLPVDESAAQRCFGNGSSLYFHARLEKNGILTLLPPERAVERRLFRKFGSHRFLNINVLTTVPINVRESFFGSPKNQYGRHWSLFWCKMGKSPQSYILFAESGMGISSEDERSVAQLWEWCIPQALNPDITVGKFMKRLKLSFSKVTPAGVLPEGSVELLPDFGVVGEVQEIDGCGLISKEGLYFVWREYCQRHTPSSNEETTDADEVCPNTGFQGRLGGFKGTWQLDESLGEGIRLQCRSSQSKYRLPQKCLPSSLEGGDFASYDPEYDTIEVCSWDKKPQSSTLNTRVIQMLEAGGVPDEHLLKCADYATRHLSALSDNPDLLIKLLKKRQTGMTYRQDEGAVEKAENSDSAFVFRMGVEKVDHNDPVFLQRRKRLVRKEFEQMRKKVNIQ
jgi:hypothetical protein